MSAPTAGNVLADGRFRPAPELRARFAALGVTAAAGDPGGAAVGHRYEQCQKRNVQNVIATARFCVGMPTCETTTTPTNVPATIVARRSRHAPDRRKSAISSTTVQRIHPMLPISPSSARLCRIQFCALSGASGPPRCENG